MPLDRLVLILVIVIAAGGATLWLGAVVASAFAWPGGVLLLLPAALVAYIAVRVIGDRLGSAEDDHYDRME